MPSAAGDRTFAAWLGRRDYEPILHLQERLVQLRGARLIPDVVLLLEHEPVITLGRNAQASNVLAPPASLREDGVSVVHTGRGGDVTYHGPGQLVGYPILDLKPHRCDTRKYVRCLCEVMMRIALQHGVAAGTVEGMIGVWVDAERPDRWAVPHGSSWPTDTELVKIGAVGVRLTRWISMHGFALNLHTDLQAYGAIIPCGITSHGVASLASLTGLSPDQLTVSRIALASAPVLSAGLQLAVPSVADLSTVGDGALEDELRRLVR